MDISKLLTYSFSKNVGLKDRIFRIISGLAIILVPSVFNLSKSISITLFIAGFTWLVTGIVSRCGAYYILGISTRKRKM